MMKKYRIGRVHLPWTNLEPPIRSSNPPQNPANTKKEAGAARKVERKLRGSIDLSSVRTPYGNLNARPGNCQPMLTLYLRLPLSLARS